MASTFSPNLSIELIGTGDQAGTWGTTTNSNLGTLIEQAISGYVTQAVATGTDTTITIPNGATGVARNMYIELTGTGGASTNLIVPANKKLYFIFNNSSGAVTVKVSGQTGVSVPTGKKMVLVSNGTDIVNGLNYIADFGTNSFTVTNLTASSGTITNLIATSGSITNLVSSDASATVLRAGSATLTHLSATSASITNLSLTSLTISSLSITNVSVASATVSSNLTLSGGTANGVLYLNGSKVATSGSALTFDGTDFKMPNGGSMLLGASVAGASLLLINGTAAAQRLVLGTSGTDAVINATRTSGTSPNLLFQLEGANSMALTSTGLGIGTASPAFKLHVSGSSSQFALISTTDTTSTTGVLFGDSASNTVGRVEYVHSDNGMRFYTNGTTQATLDSSGNLGIGTASPAYKLDVAGNINAGVTVGVNNSSSGASAISRFIAIGDAGNAVFGMTSSAYTDITGAADSMLLNASSASGGISFALDGVLRMKLDTSGNLGIGTASPTNKLNVSGNGYLFALNGGLTNRVAQTFGNTGGGLDLGIEGSAGGTVFTGGSSYAGVIGTNNATVLQLGTNGTIRATLDTSGNLGIGTASPTGKVACQVTASGTFQNAYVASDGASSDFLVKIRTNETQIMNSGASVLSFGTSNTERARITSGGRFLVGTTTTTYPIFFELPSDSGDWFARFHNTQSTSPYGLVLSYTAASPNGTGNEFLYCLDNASGGTLRAAIRSNGGIANYQSNNVDLSDIRTKKDIAPAASMWGKVAALEIVAYKYNDQTHDDVNLGVIAQQVEAVEPVWVDADGFGKTPEDGVPLKTVYTKDITFAAIKALQEAMARIETLEAKVTALESK